VKGSFILAIVADEINEEVNRIIRYINECSSSAFSLHTLEMSQFQSSNLAILVPLLYGNSAKVTMAGQKQCWNEERSLKAISGKKPL